MQQINQNKIDVDKLPKAKDQLCIFQNNFQGVLQVI